MLKLKLKSILKSDKLESNKKIALSLFSGCGGDTLGMINANYDVKYFSEFDKNAIKSHLLNFNSTLVEENGFTDIKKISNETFEKLKPIDLIFSGFPCQGFSNAGKKDSNDSRNELVYEFIRATDVLKPEWIIGENVSGLLTKFGNHPITNKKTKVIDIISDLFKQIGYTITYNIVNAVSIGVPQLRKRLIIVGHRDELSINGLIYPLIDFHFKSWAWAYSDLSIRKFIIPTLKGAIKYNTDVNNISVILTTETESSGIIHPNLIKIASNIRNLSSKEIDFIKIQSNNDNSDLNICDSDSLNRINGYITSDTLNIIMNDKNYKFPNEIYEELIKSKKIYEINGLLSYGKRATPYHCEIIDPDMPSKTIICTYGTCPRLFVCLKDTNNQHWIRPLLPIELCQIQGFPKDFKFSGNDKDIIKQIGNAVPPRMIEMIIKQLDNCKFIKEKENNIEINDDQYDDE
jgi:DNA (cytosine-5)-methyltransferase 1